MATPYQLSASTVVDAGPDVAYQGLVDAPLEVLFPTRSGVIPPIRRCEDQGGPWGNPGQTRTVILADGSRNVETLVGADRATRDYRYTLTDFTGPMKLLVRKVEGRFAFDPADAGTKVTWSWTVHPTNPLARLTLPVLGASWRKMARDMWPRFATRLSTP
jgi:hypothetical protein